MAQLLRYRTLIIGCDYSTLHSYWRTAIQTPNLDIQGFIYCQPDEPPFLSFKGFTKQPIHIFPLNKLEEVIDSRRIQKCQFQAQNIPMKTANSIINRIIAKGCTLEMISPKDLLIKCFKPIFLISSLIPAVGKTQIAQYICSILFQHKRVAIIIPILDIPRQTINKKAFSVDDDALYEFKVEDEIPTGIFTDNDRCILQEYQKCGAFRIFATSDVRRALICAEQHADAIIVDSRQCELSLVESDYRFCVITANAIENVRETSLWPGLVNLYRSNHVILVSQENLPESYLLNVRRMLPDKDLHLVLSKISKPNPSSSSTIKTVSDNLSEDTNDNSSSQPAEISSTDESECEIKADEYENHSLVSLENESSSSSIPEKIDFSKIYSSFLNAPPSTPSIHASEHINEIGENTTAYVAAAPQRDIDGLPHQKHIIHSAPEIVDVNNTLQEWLSQFYSNKSKPQLQEHFATQVDIIMAMSQASCRELKIGNNDSANREAFCRLFLSSHIPPGFRVTTGEIIDALSNTTGQLDVVVVNDSCPRLTIDSTNSIIAPILADTVLCVIEVKTSLTPDQLTKALSQLRPVKALMPSHSTLAEPNGDIVQDPLEGKIITGVFSFNQGAEIESTIDNILSLYPGVADFIVLPSSFGYFSAETLKVCGFNFPNLDSQIANGYVKFTSRGMGLAIIFGILNSMAAIRRFSGSNCIRYLQGYWSQFDYVSQLNKSLIGIDKFVQAHATKQDRQAYFKNRSDLQEAVSNWVDDTIKRNRGHRKDRD